MARDELTGNMPTERIVEYFGNDLTGVKASDFAEALRASLTVFA